MKAVEREIDLLVRCPVCGAASVTAYRYGVVAEALSTGAFRLYSGCHLAAWDASESDLDLLRARLWENRLPGAIPA